MKFIPESKHDSLILSGIHDICHEHGVPKELAIEVQKHFSEHLEALENDPEASYENENQKIAGLFQQWIHALHGDDKQKAKQIENEIETSVEEHPFPYSEVADWYRYSVSKGYPRKASYAAALNNYRDCENKGNDFGVISNKVSNNAKIGIIGDWGTGTEDATYLLKEMMLKAPDMEAILHLGDIYQCGTPFECIQNFMNPINEVFDELNIPKIPIFTIPGNHEYYTGAKGYFQLIDVLNSELDSGWKQEASYFCLRSEDESWQFLGADTGLNCINYSREPGLQPTEADWHIARLKESSGKSVLLTHHQFVSANDQLNPAGSGDLAYYNKSLLSQFKGHLDHIDLWLWGHDHHFIPYIKDLPITDDYQEGDDLKNIPLLKRGQLLGGSARETSVKKTFAYASAVQDDKEGSPIVPSESTTGLSNHTYGIIDLQLSKISYYEVGAWGEYSKPYRFAPENPLFVCDI